MRVLGDFRRTRRYGGSRLVVLAPVAWALAAACAVAGPDEDRYYQPIIDTYQRPSEVVEESDYFVLFDSQEAARQGVDSSRLQNEHGVYYRYYTGAPPICRNELDEYFAASEVRDRENDKRDHETACIERGQRLQMGFKWHCYPKEEQEGESGCQKMSCFTHFYCQ